MRGYLGGFVAAMMTKSGTIGVISGIPVPVIQEYNAGFARGAKRFNPDVKFLTAHAGSFSDIAKAKEIALGLIEQGADVVSAGGNESVLGTLEAAMEKHVLRMIGKALDAPRAGRRAWRSFS